MVENVWIETERLIIRTYKKEDVKGLYETLNDKKNTSYIVEDTISMKQAEEAVEWLINNYSLDAEYKYSFPIILRETNQYIGWCGFGYLDYDKSQTEIYYTLKSEYWNNGYATEAVRAILDFILNQCDIRELVAVVKPENIASKKII